MATIERVGPGAFDGARLTRPGRWGVAFLADWCPFCREFAPEFVSLAGAGAELLVADMTDLGSPLWDRFQIEVVPTVIVFQDGRAVARVDGIAGEGIDRSRLLAIRNALAVSPGGDGSPVRGPNPKGATR